MTAIRLRLVAAAGALLLLLAVMFGLGSRPATAAAGGNFVATGHDLDLHCYSGDAGSCGYFRVVVQKVQNGSSLPILALDQGSQVSSALTAAGVTATVVTVDPTSAAFATTAFTSSSGTPSYSAIVVASDVTCGGCDNSRAAAEAVNTRAADFARFFNAGGGILALAGAEDRDIYYNFVPLTGVSAAPVTAPFTVTPAGTALGLTDAQANCCPTHNSFNSPGSPFVILEKDSAGLAETIAVFGGAIAGGGFTTPPSPSATPTATISPSATATSSPSATPTASITPSPSSSASPTGSPSGRPGPSCRPGWGYGDRNHCHSGPPGQARSARSHRRR